MKRYKILSASAVRLLELAVDEALEQGCECYGGVHGNLGQGFMQSIVCEEEEDETPDE